MRKDSLLEWFKENPGEGISTEEISKKFNFSSKGSASKLVHQLREEGYVIRSDRLSKAYFYEGKSEKKTIKEDNIIDSLLKTGNKRARVLECLIKSGKQGETSLNIAEYAGITKDNVCHHIFSLRSHSKLKIVTKNGRYYLSSKLLKNSQVKVTSEIKKPTPNITSRPESEVEKLQKIVKDPELIKGLKIISPEDMDSYLDLLKKIVYYKQCALNFVNTTEIISGVKTESISIEG